LPPYVIANKRCWLTEIVRNLKQYLREVRRKAARRDAPAGAGHQLFLGKNVENKKPETDRLPVSGLIARRLSHHC
jgi:hypothetical protein